MLYSVHLYDSVTSLTSFFLFHFIFAMLSIFMIIINIPNIELINATENSLLNISSVRTFFFTNCIIPYLSHSYSVKIEGLRYEMDKNIV